ncbi:MAG: flavin monoamine oxidase family protein [Lacipirellulaceae bacterium]
MTTYDAVIVGAGIAGLSAAWRLAGEGKSVVLLEARDAVGGRTRSLDGFVSGSVAELGAEFVGSNHPFWLGYAEEFGIELVEPEGGDAGWVELDGAVLRGDDLHELWEEEDELTEQINEAARDVNAREPWKTPDAERLDQTSLAEAIDALDGTDRAKRAMKLSFEHSEAAAPDTLSWLGMLTMIKAHGVEAYWEDSETYVVPGGVQQLARGFAERLPAGVVLTGAAAKSIAMDQRGGEVTTDDGRRFAGRWVILATPVSQWPKIAIDPPLPEAARRLSIGAGAKAILDFGPKPWGDAGGPSALSSEPPGVLWTSLGPATLTWFTTGPTAAPLAELTQAERLARFQTMLDRDPTTRTRAWRAHCRQEWTGEPRIEGAYSAASIGKATELGPMLVEGHGRLLFAGEHASLGYTGYMEGALESAARACRRIIDGKS